jgi:hypothetical protein
MFVAFLLLLYALGNHRLSVRDDDLRLISARGFLGGVSPCNEVLWRSGSSAAACSHVENRRMLRHEKVAMKLREKAGQKKPSRSSKKPSAHRVKQIQRVFDKLGIGDEASRQSVRKIDTPMSEQTVHYRIVLSGSTLL